MPEHCHRLAVDYKTLDVLFSYLLILTVSVILKCRDLFFTTYFNKFPPSLLARHLPEVVKKKGC